MTSKEAFKKLKENAQEICEWERDRLKIIEKDFEVLEILKRHSTRLDDEDWNDNIFNGIDYENLDEKERKIIKEWLENDDK